MSKYLEVRAAMIEVIANLDISFNLNTYANLGIVFLSTASLEATFTINEKYECFFVETMYGIEGYDSANGDKVWDVPTTKAAIVRAFQNTHCATES